MSKFNKSLIFLLLMVFMASFALGAPDVPQTVLSTAGAWQAMNREDRIRLITDLIAMYKKDGVIIRKEPAFYADEIEAIRNNNIDMVTEPIGGIFRTLTIVYRDFDNGENPDELIKKEYGEQLARQLKEAKISQWAADNYREWKQTHRDK